MMKVSIKNKGESTISVPGPSLVPGCRALTSMAEPGESAEFVFRVTQANDIVRGVVEDWALRSGLKVSVSFSAYRDEAEIPPVEISLPSNGIILP